MEKIEEGEEGKKRVDAKEERKEKGWKRQEQNQQRSKT